MSWLNRIFQKEKALAQVGEGEYRLAGVPLKPLSLSEVESFGKALRKLPIVNIDDWIRTYDGRFGGYGKERIRGFARDKRSCDSCIRALTPVDSDSMEDIHPKESLAWAVFDDSIVVEVHILLGSKYGPKYSTFSSDTRQLRRCYLRTGEDEYFWHCTWLV